MVESGFTGSGDKLEDVAPLEAKRLDDRKDTLDEATPFWGLSVPKLSFRQMTE